MQERPFPAQPLLAGAAYAGPLPSVRCGHPVARAAAISTRFCLPVRRLWVLEDAVGVRR
jgi:hypothetical protein